MIYDLDPAEIAERTALSQASQRDWRRRGFMEGIGQMQPNGRWMYSINDAVSIGIARLLLTKRLSTDINDALRVAMAVKPHVVAWLEPEDASSGWQADLRNMRYVASFGALIEGDEVQIERFVEIANVFAMGLPACLLIDCRAIANDLSPKISDLILNMVQRRGERHA